MLFLILIPTFIFLLSAFLGNLSITVQNSFIAYVFFQVNFLLSHLFLFFAGFCIVMFIVVNKQQFDKKDIFHKNYVFSFLQTIAVCIISIFLGYVLLLVIAWVEVNTFSVLTTINPSLVGITTNTQEIYKKLQKINNTPRIIATDKSGQKEAVAIAQAITGTTSFYGNSMFNAIPDFLIIPIQRHTSSLMLIDNVLIVADVTPSDMHDISPLIGYLLVQEYFPTRSIRHFPKIDTMNEEAFVVYRQDDAHSKLATINAEIQKMTDGVGTISAVIQKDTDAVAANTTLQQDAIKKQNDQYNACLSAGSYASGVFHPQNSKTDCLKILDIFAGTFDTLTVEEKQSKDQLQKDQQLLNDYKYYENFFKAQKLLISVTDAGIPSELGVFIPPDSIKIVVSSRNSHSIADYFETLAHEYLHYASYVQGKRLDSSFFEEGLTEYFARQTIKDTLQIDTNIGYPVAVKIIAALTKRIAEVDLADIYFSKDEVGLEKILDTTYGDNFYKDTSTLFETLQYTSDPQQVLQLANTIMKKIGGEPVTETDLYSTKSSL